MKNLVILSLTFVTSIAFASEKFTVETIEVPVEKSSLKGMEVSGAGGGYAPGSYGPGDSYNGRSGFSGYGYTQQEPKQDPLDRVGQVISTARDIVALGEAVYSLVQKGKPSNTTEYAPISIVPKDPISKEIIDPFEMETCSMPVERKFVTTIKSGSKEAVRFEYMVIYVYGCSYNGSGKFIQTAMVQPVSVKTNYGWDFNASMKLSGVMNHGTKADPIVGALLTMKYQMNSWSSSFERNDTVHITGAGQLKNYTR